MQVVLNMVRWCRVTFGVILQLGLAHAATLQHASLDELIGLSSAVVRGQVASSYCAAHGSAIYTHLKVRVLDRWKGSAGSEIEVIVPGGVVGRIRQSFVGVPELAEGKEYVLFLWTGPSGATRVLGLTQGVFDLPKNAAGDSMAVRAATSEWMLEASTGRMVRGERIEMPVGELRRRVVSSVERGPHQ